MLIYVQSGFRRVLSTPALIVHIAYALHVNTSRVQTLTAEVLAAICVLSLTEGHRLVLAAMSDYKVEFEETFRFEQLVSTLRLSSAQEFGSGKREDEGAWDARAATMAFINSLINCPESLEERMVLRDEFTRRGLDEVVTVRARAYVPSP